MVICLQVRPRKPYGTAPRLRSRHTRQPCNRSPDPGPGLYPQAPRHPPRPLPVAFLATPRDVFRLALSSGPRFPTASGMSFIQNCSIGYRGIPAPTGRAT